MLNMKILFILLLFSISAFGQNFPQIGQNIEGDESFGQSGHSVSISADGQRVAIGAPFSPISGGKVSIYQFVANGWERLGEAIHAENHGDECGISVAISANGRRVAVGARYNDGPDGRDRDNYGHVRVYEWSGVEWVQLGSDIDGEAIYDESGTSVSLSFDGSRVAIGAPKNNQLAPDEFGFGTFDAGHVRIFEWSGHAWISVGGDIDAGTSEFHQGGHSVSINADGKRVAIGAIGNGGPGYISVYEFSGNTWEQLGAVIEGEMADGGLVGQSVSMSANGRRIAIGAPEFNGNGELSGQTRVYEWSGDEWLQRGQFINGEAAGDKSGTSVALSANGRRLAIGAPGNSDWAGHVRIYDLLGDRWVQLKGDINGDEIDDESGSSVSLSADGQQVAIGSPWYSEFIPNEIPLTQVGHVRVYRLPKPDSLAPRLDVDGFYESNAEQTVTVDAMPVDGYPVNFTYQWYLNGIAIPSVIGGTASNYTIDGLVDNEGTWRVVVTNSAGSAEASFEYRVFTDRDGDGLSDYMEVNISRTNPNNPDTDGDQLSDAREYHDLPTNPNNPDTDGEGLPDGEEYKFGSDPTLADTDSDGLSDLQEYKMQLNPNLGDTDGDGLGDAREVSRLGTNPAIADTVASLADALEQSISNCQNRPSVADYQAVVAQRDAAIVQRDARPTLAEVRDARVGSIVLEKDAQTGEVSLCFGLQTTDDFLNWLPYEGGRWGDAQNGEFKLSLPLGENRKWLRLTLQQQAE